MDNTNLSVVDAYFDLPETKNIINSMEEVRQKAQNAKKQFYKKYRRILILVYVVIFLLASYIGELNFMILIVPFGIFIVLGKAHQGIELQNNKVTTNLFGHFLSVIFSGSKFDEKNSLYHGNPQESNLFMRIYEDEDDNDGTGGHNSIYLPIIGNGQNVSVELQGIEAWYSKEVGSGKNKRTIIDGGFLCKIIFHNPKRIINKSVLIDQRSDGRLSDLPNQIKLEQQEFEEYFNVYSEDGLEARMILTPNVMFNLTNFIKDSKYQYKFRFIDNIFYIKKIITSSIISMDRDVSIVDNKKAFQEFYNSIEDIKKIVNALNVDYYNKIA